MSLSRLTVLETYMPFYSRYQASQKVSWLFMQPSKAQTRYVYKSISQVLHFLVLSIKPIFAYSSLPSLPKHPSPSAERLIHSS